MFFDVTVKSTAAASHLHDDLRLFRFFRIGSAPRFTSCPYGTEHFAGAVLFLLLPGGDVLVSGSPIGAAVRPSGEEPDHLVLVQIHFADVVVVLLVVGAVDAVFTFSAHGTVPPFAYSFHFQHYRSDRAVRQSDESPHLQFF